MHTRNRGIDDAGHFELSRGMRRFIEGSGLDYRMTAFGTLVEGSWTNSLHWARECHLAVRSKIKRVLTLIRIDDYGERVAEIGGVVQRVEQKLGKPCDSRSTPSP